MLDVLNFFFKNGLVTSSYFRKHKNDLILCMDSYNLIVKLKEENFLEEIEDEDLAEIEDKNLTKINLLLIESISFQCGSPLYTNNDVEQADYMLPYTYC